MKTFVQTKKQPQFQRMRSLIYLYNHKNCRTFIWDNSTHRSNICLLQKYFKQLNLQNHHTSLCSSRFFKALMVIGLIYLSEFILLFLFIYLFLKFICWRLYSTSSCIICLSHDQILERVAMRMLVDAFPLQGRKMSLIRKFITLIFYFHSHMFLFKMGTLSS